MVNAKNLSAGKLYQSISSSTTDILVYVGDGSASAIESVWASVPFYATIAPANPVAGVANSMDSEIVLVSAVGHDQAGNTVLTVTRGQRGTTAKGFNAGAIVVNGVYSEDVVFLGEEIEETEPTPWITNDMLDKGTFTFGNYSTTEKDTGFTWIDGKHIYQKTINFGALPNNASKYVDINTSIDFVVKIETIVYNSTSAHSVNGSYGAAGSGLVENALLTTNKTQLAITTDRDRSSLSAYITVYYTKTT